MNLITFLKTNKNARKIFGQRELKIIEKQLRGINLTQSERNRLSRDIRQKFVFIKEAVSFQAEFELKKGALILKKINQIKKFILEDQLYPKIKKIILFGSFVENTMTFRSDIDVAVVFDNIDVTEATKFRIRTLSRSPEQADIQVYNILPAKIKKEINSKGRILYENKRENR